MSLRDAPTCLPRKLGRRGMQNESKTAARSTVIDTFEIQRYNGSSEILQAVLGMEKRNFSKADSWNGILEKEVARRNTFLLYAVLNSKVVGYVIFTINKLLAHISKVAVDKQHRRRGVGKRLVQGCLDVARRERKVLCATLHVDPTNAAARGLYQGLGFRIDGVLQDYYSQGRPAWKMMLSNLNS